MTPGKAWPLALLLLALPAVAQEPGSVAGWQESKPAGCMVWVAEVPPGGSVTWSGTCTDHQATGRGTVTMRKGEREDVYTGDYRFGRMTGPGTATYGNGNRFDGEMRDGLPNGKGLYRFAEGDRYEGNFQRGRFSGQGVYTLNDGGTYVGAFKDDKFHGQGVLTLANGDRYDGAFADDFPNGQGRATYAGGKTESGIWRDGCLTIGKRIVAIGRPAEACK